MRAAAIDKFGDPEVLKLQTLPVPIPDPREVLIEVDTAGVGPWDTDIRGGWSTVGDIKFPYALGYEGSGTVVSAGSHIHRFKIGDHVYAYSWTIRREASTLNTLPSRQKRSRHTEEARSISRRHVTDFRSHFAPGD